MITILITGAGTTTTLSVIKGIRQQKEFSVRVISCDKSDNVSGRYMSDRFYKIPSAEDPGFAVAGIFPVHTVRPAAPAQLFKQLVFAEKLRHRVSMLVVGSGLGPSAL